MFHEAINRQTNEKPEQTKCQGGHFLFTTDFFGGLQYGHNHKTTTGLPLENRLNIHIVLHNNVRSLLLAQDALYGSVFTHTLPCHKPALPMRTQQPAFKGKLR